MFINFLFLWNIPSSFTWKPLIEINQWNFLKTLILYIFIAKWIRKARISENFTCEGIHLIVIALRPALSVQAFLNMLSCSSAFICRCGKTVALSAGVNAVWVSVQAITGAEFNCGLIPSSNTIAVCCSTVPLRVSAGIEQSYSVD